MQTENNTPEVDLLAMATAPPLPAQQSRLKQFAKNAASRSAGSLFWHVFFGVFVNWSALIWGIGAAAAALAALIGWKVAAPESDQEKAKSLIARAKESAPIPVVTIAQKTPEQVEAERRKKLDKLRAEAEIHNIKYEESWSVEKLEVYVDKAKEDAAEEKKAKAAESKERERKERDEAIERARQEGLADQAQKAIDRERAERKELFDIIDNIGGVIPRLDTPTQKLRELAAFIKKHQKEDDEYEDNMALWEEEVKEAEKAPNAACPFCNYKMHINKSRIGTQGVCPYCSKIFACRNALARGTPPPQPAKPKMPDSYTLRRGEKNDSTSFNDIVLYRYSRRSQPE